MKVKYPHSPGITSFVIRFVYDESPTFHDTDKSLQPAYRGAIRHIQSEQEISFSNWREAVEFIRQFVPLELDA
jgi:hypothetical protein